MATPESSSNIKIVASGALEASLGSPESILHVKRLLKTPGMEGSEFAESLKCLLPLESPFLAIGWREAASKVKDFIIGSKTTLIGTEQSWIPIHIHSIYCPPVRGSKVTLTVATKTEDNTNCKLEILAIGGGNEFSIEFAVNDKIEVVDRNSAVAYEFLTTWHHLEIIGPNGERSKFLKLSKIHQEAPRIVVSDFDLEPWRPCARNKTIAEFDLRNSSSSMTRTLSLKEGVKSQGIMNIKLKGFGTEFHGEYVATRNWQTDYSYALLPGYYYRVVQVSNVGDWRWLVDK